jgi:hypothetical protein
MLALLVFVFFFVVVLSSICYQKVFVKTVAYKSSFC